MKKILVASLLLPFLAFKCDKSVQDTFLEGKVVRISCASFIVQVLNNDAVGEDGWKDMMNNNAVYDNVFTANNKCAIPNEIKAGNIIRFKLDKPTQNDCVICMMYDGPPQTKYDIKEVSLVQGK
jgi:hypothetical protein